MHQALPSTDPAAGSSRAAPTGTVTFLFTDIEGSTALWEHDAEAMERAFARQEAIVRQAMATHGGYVYKMIGDAFQVAFATASAALAGAAAAQRALQAEEWGAIGALKVRMALHTGVAEERGDDYVGPDLNRIARLLNAGHGGQLLLSQATADLVRDHLPADISLRDLGEHSLKDLTHPEHIYQAVAPGLAEDFAPLKTTGTRPHNLPSPATSFVGREAELAQIAALLGDPQCKLVSLVGLGGSGKTRLAIQAAARTIHADDALAFSHGATFVDLAPVTTFEGTIAAIADALQISFYVASGSHLSTEAAQGQLLGYLVAKEILLVLDNLEHLLAEEAVAGPVAELVAGLVAAAPGVKLIATSRERLNLPGEWVVAVAGLPFPDSIGEENISEYAAVRLFIQGARRVGSFAPAAADWPAIARVCQLLGGMPLGIEMAAAWTTLLSCKEIATELERDLLSLIATWRTVPERHRTLRTVFEHSWRLLAEEERAAFGRLSVFRGSFDRQAAAEVAGVSLALLAALIDKSLVRRTSAGRFEIHTVLRQAAAEKLAADPVVHRETCSRHARTYGEWLGLMNNRLKGSEQLAALVALRAEVQNLHDAWQWLIEQRDLPGLHGLLPGIILFHEMGGRPVGARETARLLREMLGILGYDPNAGPASADAPVTSVDVGPDDSLLALTLAALRHFQQTPERKEWTDAYQRASLEIAQRLPDSQEKAFAIMLNTMGPSALTYQQSLAWCQQCVGMFQRLGDTWGTALAQLILADAASFWEVVDADLARRSYQASLEGFTRLGNDWGRALCLGGLAHIEHQAGHLEEAYRMVCQSLDVYARMDDLWRMIMTRRTAAEVAEGLGRFDEARRYLETNLAFFVRVGNARGQADCRERLQRLDEYAQAAGPEMQPDEPSTLVHSSPPPRPPDGDLVEPLSARELDILKLLAEGLTNREIAQRLCLSPNTVRVHTSHIYGKLGVNNRTQAVSRAKALGLLASS